ncbi:MAG: hypothetical protein ACPG6P_11375 [Akkermansiaceae bacterium]
MRTTRIGGQSILGTLAFAALHTYDPNLSGTDRIGTFGLRFYFMKPPPEVR